MNKILICLYNRNYKHISNIKNNDKLYLTLPPCESLDRPRFNVGGRISLLGWFSGGKFSIVLNVHYQLNIILWIFVMSCCFRYIEALIILWYIIIWSKQ